MAAPAVILVLILVLAGLVLFWLLRWSRQRGTTAAALEGDETETLEYTVPSGQDPVVVMTALERAGFTTTLDKTGEVLRIHCPDGRDSSRERARAAISGADTSAIDHGRSLGVDTVRFHDER
jgi:hypothetical protein